MRNAFCRLCFYKSLNNHEKFDSRRIIKKSFIKKKQLKHTRKWITKRGKVNKKGEFCYYSRSKLKQMVNILDIVGRYHVYTYNDCSVTKWWKL